MGALSVWHILILAVIALVLFGGRGKVSDLMGDFGKGMSSFRKGLNAPDRDDVDQANSEIDDSSTKMSDGTPIGRR